MFVITVVMVLIVSVSSGKLTSDVVDRRIAGSSSGKADQFPYYVSLRAQHRHFCGAALISPRFVITAAHCLTYQWALTMYIVAGTPVIDEGFASTVQEFYKHPEYKKFSTWHDIAMLYLRLTVPEDKFMRRVYQATDIEMGIKATISGYGIMGTPKPGEPVMNPRVIQYLHVKVIDNISCNKLLPPGKVFNHTFCTISPKGYGPCHGDSGGPVVQEGALIGLISGGSDPCALGYPTVHTRIDRHVFWIHKVIVYVENNSGSHPSSPDEIVDYAELG